MQSNTRRDVRSPLLRSHWNYIDKRSLEECRAGEWQTLASQKREYLNARCADEVLRMLKVQENDPSFGYSVNMYQHCLQTATLMYRDNLPEEDVVVGLLHDIGYMVCPDAHGQFAALLLRPYISDRNFWMLEHHEVFQQVHFHDMDGIDRNERDQWRDNPYFDWTATFIAKYDQVAINFDNEILPIEEFEPMVRRVFDVEHGNTTP